jgi:23S rRNA (guanosine2251-2'-O)-methyltransferase
MDEIEREPHEDTPPAEGRSESAGDQSGPADATEHPGGPPPWAQGRRRRGRRGRGGRGPVGPGGPFPAPRPPEDDEGSQQSREIAAYERRQRQPQRGPGQWRSPGFRPQITPSRAPGFGGPRPGAFSGPRPGGFGGPRPGGFGQRPGGFAPRPGAQRGGGRYQELVRRATSGPRTGPPEEAGEPIAGPHAVLEALRAGRVIRRINISSDRGVRSGAVNDLIREAQERRVQVRFIDPMEVQRLSPGVEHQGVVAIAEGRAGVELDELLLHLETVDDPPLVVVIDSLQDPQNFGVLLRSAEGAGAHGVVIPRHRQVGITPAVGRTSAGASEHLLIADVVNLRQAIDTLKERSIWVVGTDDSGDLEWDAVDYRGPTAIVVGGEGEGIRRLVLDGCDQVVRIPMQGKVSSLNAAAAGTVVLFEALRQRMRDAAPPVVERRAPPSRDEVIPVEDEQDEIPEGEDRFQQDAEEGATDLMRDEEAPAGDEIRGDDQDVEEFAEATADEHSEVDTDAMDALPPGAPPIEDKPARKRTAPKKTTAKKTTAKRTTRKKTAED